MFIFEKSILQFISYSKSFFFFFLKQQKCACEILRNVEPAT